MSRVQKLDLPTSVSLVFKQSLQDQIVPLLREDIIAGLWSPGQRLSEPALCKRYGVSRTPLRNAFRVLASEGLIELLPNRGAVVTEPTATDIEDKLDVLTALEVLAIELACDRAPGRQIKKVASLHNQMMKAFHRHDALNYYELNARIHRAIVEASGSVTLASFHQILTLHLDRIRQIANIGEELSERSKHEHEEIIEALQARNRTAAGEAMHRHMSGVKDKIRTAMTR